MSNRTLSLTDSLYDYLLEVSLREPPLLARLRAETEALSVPLTADVVMAKVSVAWAMASLFWSSASSLLLA